MKLKLVARGCGRNLGPDITNIRRCMMYSYEQRKKAVKLYFQFDQSWRAVQVELGYPNSVTSIRNWVIEFRQENNLHKNRVGSSKYSEKQRQKAVAYYLNHGKNVSRTCRKLGCPSRTLLTQWIMEDLPQEQHNCRKGSPLVKCSQKEKEAAVLEMCNSASTIQSIADRIGVSRAALYDGKAVFFAKETNIQWLRKESLLTLIKVSKNLLLSGINLHIK